MAPRGQGASSHVQVMTSFSSRDHRRHAANKANHNLHEQRYFSKLIRREPDVPVTSLWLEGSDDVSDQNYSRRSRDQSRLEEQRKQFPLLSQNRRGMENKYGELERKMDLTPRDREEKPTRERDKETEPINEQYQRWKTFKKRAVKGGLGNVVDLEQPLFGRDSDIVALRRGIYGTEQTNPTFENMDAAERLFGRGSRILALRSGEEDCRYGELEPELGKPTSIDEMELKPKCGHNDGDKERPQDKAMKLREELAANFNGKKNLEKIGNMIARDWQDYTEDLNIFYKASRIPCQKQNNEDLGAIGMELFNTIVRSIVQKATAKYKKPSPIQIAATISLLGYDPTTSLSLLKHALKYSSL